MWKALGLHLCVGIVGLAGVFLVAVVGEPNLTAQNMRWIGQETLRLLGVPVVVLPLVVLIATGHRRVWITILVGLMGILLSAVIVSPWMLAIALGYARSGLVAQLLLLVSLLAVRRWRQRRGTTDSGTPLPPQQLEPDR